jgi:hypothetical protein
MPMELKDKFILLFSSISILIDTAVIFSIEYHDKLDLLCLTLILLVNIGVAYRVTEVVLSLCADRMDLPKLEKLNNYPSVALLYVTYNDVFPQILSTLKNQEYPNYDIFVLDDSTNEACKNAIDKFGFVTIRRDNRVGYKAGALNNWLYRYGKKYKYFVVSDSDSYFESGFIENMVRYAEHKANVDVAIFQSRITNWNYNKIFPRMASISLPIFDFINLRLANDCEYIICWGHNNLHRTESILKNHGFNEKFVAEDLASGFSLIKLGYKCKLVDVISYDMFPESIRAYSRRQIRWSKQNIELVKLNFTQVNMLTKLHFYMHIYDSLIWIVFFIGILISIFLYDSSLKYTFILYSFDNLLNGKEAIRYILYFFYTLSFFFVGLPIVFRLKISLTDYYKSFALLLAVSFFIMPYLVKELIKTLFGCKTVFSVTNKRDQINQDINIFNEFYISTAFFVIVVIKIINSPFIIIYNFIWIVPFLLSPAIIYFIHRQTALGAPGLSFGKK